MPPKLNVCIFCYSWQHFVDKFSSLNLNLKLNLKPITLLKILLLLSFFKIGLDRTEQFAEIYFSTFSKDSISQETGWWWAQGDIPGEQVVWIQHLCCSGSWSKPSYGLLKTIFWRNTFHVSKICTSQLSCTKRGCWLVILIFCLV